MLRLDDGSESVRAATPRKDMLMLKREHLLCGATCALVIIAGWGCKERASTDTSSDDNPSSSGVSLDEVQRQVDQAARTAGEYLAQKKDEYLAKMREELKDLDGTIAEMKEKGQELAGEAKEKWSRELSELEEKRGDLDERLREIAESSDDAWRELAKGLDSAWGDLKDAAEQLDKPADRQ
jgi:hypothetical protein